MRPCDRLGHRRCDSVCIRRAQRRDTPQQDCGGRIYLYRYSAARDCDQRRDHVAGVAHASTSAIATGPECRKGGKNATPALPWYDRHLSFDNSRFLILPIATYPRTYNPLFAMASCILAVTFSCTFSVIFPLIGPPVVLLVFLTLLGTTLTSRFTPNLTRDFSPPLPHWLCVRPDPLADRWPATNMATETLRIAPCFATHPSRPDSFQSTIMARGWRARRYRSSHYFVC
jgi:hypothetical protein